MPNLDSTKLSHSTASIDTTAVPDGPHRSPETDRTAATLSVPTNETDNTVQTALSVCEHRADILFTALGRTVTALDTLEADTKAFRSACMAIRAQLAALNTASKDIEGRLEAHTTELDSLEKAVDVLKVRVGGGSEVWPLQNIVTELKAEAEVTGTLLSELEKDRTASLDWLVGEVVRGGAVESQREAAKTPKHSKRRGSRPTLQGPGGGRIDVGTALRWTTDFMRHDPHVTASTG